MSHGGCVNKIWSSNRGQQQVCAASLTICIADQLEIIAFVHIQGFRMMHLVWMCYFQKGSLRITSELGIFIDYRFCKDCSSMQFSERKIHYLSAHCFGRSHPVVHCVVGHFVKSILLFLVSGSLHKQQLIWKRSGGQANIGWRQDGCVEWRS